MNSLSNSIEKGRINQPFLVAVTDGSIDSDG